MLLISSVSTFMLTGRFLKRYAANSNSHPSPKEDEIASTMLAKMSGSDGMVVLAACSRDD
jgi:hypothetical protein